MAEKPPTPRPPGTNESLRPAGPDPLLSEPEFISPDRQQIPLAAPKGRKAAATFIFLTVTLDMLALGMIAPVLPRLIASFMQGNDVSAAQMLGIFGTIFAAMQFFFSPVLGSLSDRFGRRPIVLLSNFGMGLDYLLMAWAPILGWLLLGRIISGLTASSIPTAMAYMADVTPQEKRAGAFGLLNAAFGMGFVLGPALGGILGTMNPRLPFLVAAILSLLNGLYGTFVLPESLSRENRSPFSWRRANPIGSLTLLARRPTRTAEAGASRLGRPTLALAAILLLGYIAQTSLQNVYVLYADLRFHWTDRTVGLSLAAVGIFTGLYGALLVKPFVARFGERGGILFGLIGGACGYACFGLSRTGLLLLCGIPLLNLMSLAWPSAQSLMSRAIGPSEQGQLQGAINGLRGIAGLIGPGLFTYIFSRSIGPHPLVPHPGTAFFLAASLLLAALLIATTKTVAKPMAAPSAT